MAYGKTDLEAGKYAVSAAGGHGVGARKERGGQHHHRCLGRHGVYESSDGIDLGAAGTLQLSDDQRERCVRHQPDDGGPLLCDRLLRRALGKRCG